MSERPVGLTRDAGWEVGVSRSFAVAPEAAWDLLVSPPGLALWLGDGVPTPLEKGSAYETSEGTSGEVRSLRPYDRVRLSWRPAGREAPATVQVAVRPAARGCSVRFHSERLASEQEREAMRRHWREALDRIGAAL